MTLDPDAPDARWSLEVVRGRKPGQVFPVLGREIILGTAPIPPTAGIDLAGQEAARTRRMADQHAMLLASEDRLAIRDLDSQAGTFVNRRRVLPGQDLPIRDGDEIHIGAVVLRVMGREPAPAKAPASSPNGTFAYALDGGPTCRTWDDFLVASTQKWAALSGDLASGRLNAFLAGIGREDLLPRSAVGSTADERLDAWLACLPTTRPSRPELDVHPSRVVIRAAPGGGTIRRTVRIANVGHRLLRSTARVEAIRPGWLRLSPEFADAPFATVEETELAFEVEVPEIIPEGLLGEIIVEGNGGSRRIAVVLEPRSGPEEIAEPEPPSAGPSQLLGLVLARASGVGIWQASVGFALFRGFVAVAGRGAVTIPIDAPAQMGPGLGGVALAMAAMGSLVGGGLAAWRGEGRAVPSGASAGGCVGAMAAALVIATIRVFEPAILGGWASSWWASCGLWAVLGVAVAGCARRAAKERP